MKKAFLVVIIIIVVLGAVDLGLYMSHEKGKQTPKDFESVSVHLNEEPMPESTLTAESGSDPSEVYFTDGVAETHTYKVKINKTEVLDTRAEYNGQEQPILVIYYAATAKTESDLSTPEYAWFDIFSAVQDTKEDYVNTLEGYTWWKYDDVADKTMKKGGTVDCAVYYLLDDMETPVVLTAHDDRYDEMGKQTIKLK